MGHSSVRFDTLFHIRATTSHVSSYIMICTSTSKPSAVAVADASVAQPQSKHIFAPLLKPHCSKSTPKSAANISLQLQSRAFGNGTSKIVRIAESCKQRGYAIRARAASAEKDQATPTTETPSETDEPVPIPDPRPPVVQAANNMGYNTSEGVFGFKPFAELWTGRFAMTGFAIGVATEILTGRGILEQVGLMEDGAPAPTLFIVLVALIGGTSLLASVKTIYDVVSKKAVPTWKEVPGRYANSPVLPSDVTSMDQSSEGDEKKAAAMLTNDASTISSDEDPEIEIPTIKVEQYATKVEISNGRWAMVGFATAILIEAATGNGIIPQLLTYGQLSGILGPESGFNFGG